MIAFDLERFRAAALVPRQAEVPVPELRTFFGAGAPETPVWAVRGLTGDELARSNESSQRSAIVANAVQALAASAGADGERVEAMKSLLGVGSEVAAELAKRLDMLVFASVAPVIDREIAVKLFETFPIVGYNLTNKILELTGQGPDLGKLASCTAIPAS